jgi:chromosome segregation ATPase
LSEQVSSLESSLAASQERVSALDEEKRTWQEKEQKQVQEESDRAATQAAVIERLEKEWAARVAKVVAALEQEKCEAKRLSELVAELEQQAVAQQEQQSEGEKALRIIEELKRGQEGERTRIEALSAKCAGLEMEVADLRQQHTQGKKDDDEKEAAAVEEEEATGDDVAQVPPAVPSFPSPASAKKSKSQQGGGGKKEKSGAKKAAAAAGECGESHGDCDKKEKRDAVAEEKQAWQDRAVHAEAAVQRLEASAEEERTRMTAMEQTHADELALLRREAAATEVERERLRQRVASLDADVQGLSTERQGLSQEKSSLAQEIQSLTQTKLILEGDLHQTQALLVQRTAALEAAVALQQEHLQTLATKETEQKRSEELNARVLTDKNTIAQQLMEVCRRRRAYMCTLLYLEGPDLPV